MLIETKVTNIRAPWHQVFVSNDPFGWPFLDQVDQVGVFFPTDGYHLTRVQYDAVAKANKCSSCFVSIVESEDLSFLERDWGHWATDLASYEEYQRLPLTLENAVFAADGSWGILVSHEMHALIGGSREFMRVAGREYAGWDRDLGSLRAEWLGHPTGEWVERLSVRLCP